MQSRYEREIFLLPKCIEVSMKSVEALQVTTLKHLAQLYKAANNPLKNSDLYKNTTVRTSQASK